MQEKPGLTIQELERRFSYHHLDTGKIHDHEEIRLRCFQLANHLFIHLPMCTELDKALEHLEEVCFWANAGIARSA